MVTPKPSTLLLVLAGLSASALGTSCSGSDVEPAPSEPSESRAPERDSRLVLFPFSEGPEGAVAIVRGEASSDTPVLLGAQFVPPVGGPSAFFQSGGDYRQCGRMESGVEYGLAWRFEASGAGRPAGSVVTVDVGLMASATKEELEALAQGQKGHYRSHDEDPGAQDGSELAEGAQDPEELVGQLEFSVGPTGSSDFQTIELKAGWSSIDLPMDAATLLSGLRLRGTAGEGTHVLIGNARVRDVQGAREGRRPPTVLFVTFDTSRADHFSSINPGSVAETPNFDRLASEGALYTNCYSATNITNPSHVTLMTGVSPRDTKIVDNKTPLHYSASTLAEQFEASGYQTYAVLSAFHLGHELSGLGQGFHRLDTTPNFARSGEETLDVARQWIGEAEGSPLFIWVHLFDPHAPYRLPDSYLRKLLDGRADPYAGEPQFDGPLRVTPQWVVNEGVKDPAFVTALYGGGVEYLDDLFGRLLKVNRMTDATVLATADHGEGLGERNVWWDHSGAFYPMLHVPMAIRDPRIAPGTVVSAPVENRGAALALLGLMDLPTRAFPGPKLPVEPTEPVADPSANSAVRFAMAAHGGSVSITDGDFTLEMFLRERDVGSSGRVHATGSCYLYDVTDDPGCTKNLVALEYERAISMRARLLKWVESAEVTGMNPVNHDVSPEILSKLASMGYSEGPEQLAKWWAPEHVAKEDGPDPWSKSPWNLGFTAQDGQAILEAAVAADNAKFAPGN